MCVSTSAAPSLQAPLLRAFFVERLLRGGCPPVVMRPITFLGGRPRGLPLGVLAFGLEGPAASPAFLGGRPRGLPLGVLAFGLEGPAASPAFRGDHLPRRKRKPGRRQPSSISPLAL